MTPQGSVSGVDHRLYRPAETNRAVDAHVLGEFESGGGVGMPKTNRFIPLPTPSPFNCLFHQPNAPPPLRSHLRAPSP